MPLVEAFQEPGKMNNAKGNRWVEHVMMATTGVAMMLIGVWSQGPIDPKYSFEQYVGEALTDWSWWEPVGLPFLAGFVLLVCVAVSIWKRSSISLLRFLLALNFLLALLLWAMVGPLGMLASGMLFVILLVHFVGSWTHKAKQAN